MPCCSASRPGDDAASHKRAYLFLFFVSLLASFERVLPLLERSNLAGRELAFPLFELSKGSIGQLTRVLRRAAVEAIRSGEERITPEILAGLDAIDLGGV